MKMTRILPLAAVSALFLSACGGSLTSEKATYALTINMTGATVVDNLTNAAMRVVERRIDAMGVVNQKNEFGEGNKSIIVSMPDKEGIDELTRQLTRPFVLEVVKQTESGSTPDFTVEKLGGFSKTNIGTADFVGVEVGTDANKKARARMILTTEGRQKLKTLLAEQDGKMIGIFLHDRLISAFEASSSNQVEDLQIQNIPNLLMAEVFMDDVNVGLHVVFTPKP